MLLGPIFSIDMLTTARRARYYALRAIYAGALLLVLFTYYYDPSDRRSYNIHEVAAMAESFFQTFTVVQLLAVACLAPALAAGTVALERERRTIEYLFATDLSNAEIVLGRLCSRMLLITSMILVSLPILALARLLGGISGERLLIVFALTMSTALFLASLSMAVSVGTTKARDAVLRRYAIVLALWIVPPVAAWLLGTWSAPQWLIVVSQWFEPLNPFQTIIRTLSSGGLDWSSIGSMMAAQTTAAAVCTASAVGLVRRIHLRAAGAAARSPGHWLGVRLLRRRRRAVADRAMLWKELVAPQSKVRLGFFGHLSLALLAMIALGTCVNALISVNQFGSFLTAGRWYLMQTGPFSDLIACCGGLAISARAAASITGERERQCWDSLISTPVEARDVVWAKILGSLYSARWLVALVAVMWGLGVLVDGTLWLPALISLATLLVVLLFGCALGVFYSAGGSSSLRAMGNTLGTLVFVGGGYLFCCIPLMMGSSSRDGEVILALCIPFLIVFPLVASESSFGGHNAPEYIAYILGMLAYGGATVVLTTWAVIRIRPDEDALRLRPQRMPPIVPEVIDEGTA